MRRRLESYGRIVLLLIMAAGGCGAAANAAEPQVVTLWPKGAPGAVGDTEKDRPTLTIHRPAKSVGAGVVVCPGGGYGTLALDHEGVQIARWLNQHGLAAFILQYRLGPRYRHPAPLQDVQRAIRYVRTNAEELGTNRRRIGVWGFSAGGHLASTAATHFDHGNPAAEDPIERASSRPDFAILCYPVISMKEPLVHKGSRRNLLGEQPSPDLIESPSNETQVTKETPPVFLFHTNADTGVVPENSVQFYLALRRAGVAAELHIYQPGRHGVGLAPTDPILSSWPDRLRDWLRLQGVLPESSN